MADGEKGIEHLRRRVSEGLVSATSSVQSLQRNKRTLAPHGRRASEMVDNETIDMEMTVCHQRHGTTTHSSSGSDSAAKSCGKCWDEHVPEPSTLPASAPEPTHGGVEAPLDTTRILDLRAQLHQAEAFLDSRAQHLGSCEMRFKLEALQREGRPPDVELADVVLDFDGSSPRRPVRRAHRSFEAGLQPVQMRYAMLGCVCVCPYTNRSLARVR